MAASGFVANDAFFDSLGRTPAIVAACRESAERIAANARVSAPVDTSDYVTSIHVEPRSAAYRDTFRVVASSEHALAVEARTGNLARAVRGVRV